jgi:hypothetical protein
MTCELRVCQPNLPAGKLFFYMQIESDKRESQFDRLVAIGESLRALAIHDMLM